MTWNTVNVPGISCTGNTAIKLAQEILNVFAMYWTGFWWILYPFPYDVLAVYPLGTPPLAPSDFRCCHLYLSLPSSLLLTYLSSWPLLGWLFFYFALGVFEMSPGIPPSGCFEPLEASLCSYSSLLGTFEHLGPNIFKKDNFLHNWSNFTFNISLVLLLLARSSRTQEDILEPTPGPVQ